MFIAKVVSCAVRLAASAWFETLVFFMGLAAVHWLAMEAITDHPWRMRAIAFSGQWLFTALSAAVLYPRFDRGMCGNPHEMSSQEFMAFVGRLVFVTFVVELIVVVGTLFCLLPGLWAAVLLFPIQMSVYRTQGGFFAAYRDTLGAAYDRRLETLALMALPALGIAVYAVSLNVFFLDPPEPLTAMFANYTAVNSLVWAVVMGLWGAVYGVLMRAIEFSFYEAATQRRGWVPPVVEPVVYPPTAKKVLPPVRPIDVGPDIKFGE